jgi:dihydrofolate synthase/folylpolyglutamate synthase
MNYGDAIEFLYGLRMFGARPGLAATRKLAELTGNPQQRLRFIHVAGTNGKGSTCAMLETIYRQAGLRVGLFTSPHLVSFGERIQVNRQAISESDVARLADEARFLLKQFPSESHPTFFEVVTVMALRHFAAEGCELVIWETGLGGRFDATNIVTPLASVITNIGLEHQQWLGDTIEKIAGEKAGIIKPGIPVITATNQRAALEVIVAAARRNDSLLTVIDGNDANGPLFDAAGSSLLGQHQRLNAALAVATVRAVESQTPVSYEAMLAGLRGVFWPGRMQVVTLPDQRTVLLDGAHNATSARALASAFAREFPDVCPTLILGVLQDKDWRAIAESLAPLAGRIRLAPVNSERALAPGELAPVCQAVNPRAAVEVSASLAVALQASAGDPFVLITGSLYLIGEAMERLGLSPVPPVNERGLNEWGAPRA